MSWFKRLRTFTEDEEILADDFEAEFDGIADALNGLFEAGEVSASAKLVTGLAYAAILGTSKEVSPTVPSLLVVNAVFDFEASVVGEGLGVLFVDGAARSGEAPLIVKVSGEATNKVRGTVSQTYVVSLAAGSHTLELRAKRLTASAVTCFNPNTKYSYLLVPNPEP